MLLFGDPGDDGTEFQRLSNVKTELEGVEKHFSEKRAYESAAATPAAYRQSRPETYSTLHFATHAVANRESPLDSAIVLAGSPESRKLYAREILQQPLTADLVTLSACQTAGSRTYYGEGLTGFSWAFLTGARPVRRLILILGLLGKGDRGKEQRRGHPVLHGTPIISEDRERCTPSSACQNAAGGGARKLATGFAAGALEMHRQEYEGSMLRLGVYCGVVSDQRWEHFDPDVGPGPDESRLGKTEAMDSGDSREKVWS